MRSQIARLLLVSVLLILLAMTVATQDTPTVTITPKAGEVEKAIFTSEIDGLLPDTSYTVEIVFAGEVVFSSEEKSDQAGHIPYPVSSTEGDAPGTYTIQVVSDGEVIASGDFILTEAEERAAKDESDFLGDVTVAPETVPFGKAQNLRIAELEPRTRYTVEITASETFQVAYRRRQTSDEDGAIAIEIFAEEGDAAGHHAIAVYDEAGELIAEGEFIIQAPPERAVSARVAPAAVEAGGTVEIAVTGMAPFDSVTAQITSSDAVLIDTVLARASSAGGATLSFVSPEDLADGVYNVDIYVEGGLLASAALTVGEVALIEISAEASIDPPQGPIGTEHRIAVRGLSPEQAFRLIILDPAGEEEYSRTREAEADGAFSMTISSTEADDIGAYTVEIRADANGKLLGTAKFEISSAEDETKEPSDEPAKIALPASATIEPQAAVIGSSHRITVRGLRAHEMVSFDVVFAGASVYSTEKTADASGAITLKLVTSDEDQPGDYTVSIRRESGNQPAVILTATAKVAPSVTSTTIGDAEVITGSLTEGSAEIEFAGETGEYVLISVASEDFDPAAALINRDDSKLAFNDDSRGQKDAIIGPLRLPYSGEYALEISAAPLMMPRGAENGDFTVTITPVTLAPIEFDIDVAFALSAETPALYYALPIETGDSLTLTVDSGATLDTLMRIVSPDGGEFAFDDDSGRDLDAELSNLVFDRAATYVLVISTFDGGASGEGAVSISRNPAHSLEEGEARVTLNDKAIRDLVVFDAEENELLILNLERVYGDVADLYVTATVEGMEVMSYSTMGVPDQLPLAFVMPMSGRVVVTLEKFGFDDGISLEVSLQRP